MAVSIYYQNVTGLRTKLDEFKMIATVNAHDIICITESWLNSGIIDSELIDLNNYTIFRRDRSTSSVVKTDGGGVFIAIKNKFKPTRATELQSDAEDIWIVLKFGIINLFICCVYLPPGNQFASASFISRLYSNKSKFEDHLVMILGDFNCPTISWVFNDGEKYSRAFNVENKYEQIVDACTYLELMQHNHIKNCNNRCLDLVFSNSHRIDNLEHCLSPLVVENRHHPALEFLFEIQTSSVQYLFVS